MNLTPLAAQTFMMGEPEKLAALRDLLGGARDITEYTNGQCYDAVAFCSYLAGKFGITPEQLQSTDSQAWVPIFNLQTQYMGGSIEAGSAVGFWRDNDGTFIHAAMSTGGTDIRGVNSAKLSPGWSSPVDFMTELVPTDEAGVYNLKTELDEGRSGGALAKISVYTG